MLAIIEASGVTPEVNATQFGHVRQQLFLVVKPKPLLVIHSSEKCLAKSKPVPVIGDLF